MSRSFSLPFRTAIALVFTLGVVIPVAQACFVSAPNSKCTRLASLHKVEPPKLTIAWAGKSYNGLAGEFCWKEYKGIVEGRGWPSPLEKIEVTRNAQLPMTFDRGSAIKKLEYRAWAVDESLSVRSGTANQRRWVISPDRPRLVRAVDLSDFLSLPLELEIGEHVVVVSVFWESGDFSTYTYYLSAVK